MRWDDTPNGGKLTVSFEKGTTSGGTTTWVDAGVKELIARIRSVAGQPGPTGSISIPFCSTAPFTLTVPVEYFVNVPNEAIPAYLWEVPAGWSVQGGAIAGPCPDAATPGVAGAGA